MAEIDYHIASLAGSKAVVAEDFGFFHANERGEILVGHPY